MKKMVITGVNGFIGRHAKEYFEKEYEITGLDLAANYCGDGGDLYRRAAGCDPALRGKR